MARMFLEIPMRPEEEAEEHGAGRSILCKVHRQLKQSGYAVHEDVQAWEDYGWSIIVNRWGANIWCMIQPSDSWLLQCWPEVGLIDRIKGRDFGSAQREVMDAISAVLAAERKVDEPRWVSRAELNASPVR